MVSFYWILQLQICYNEFMLTSFFGSRKQSSSAWQSSKTKKDGLVLTSTAIFYLNSRTNEKISGESAFVRKFEITFFIDRIDRVSICLRLRWATRDGCDHTSTPNLHAIENFDVGELYSVTLFSSSRSVHRIIGCKYCLSHFTSQHLWPLNRFFINRFNQRRHERSHLNEPFYSITLKKQSYIISFYGGYTSEHQCKEGARIRIHIAIMTFVLY